MIDSGCMQLCSQRRACARAKLLRMQAQAKPVTFRSLQNLARLRHCKGMIVAESIAVARQAKLGNLWNKFRDDHFEVFCPAISELFRDSVGGEERGNDFDRTLGA